MTATVVGIRHVDFEPEGKERIVGDKLLVVTAMNPNDQNIQGQEVDTIWVKDGSPIMGVIVLGETYDFLYDCVGRGRASLVDVRPHKK